MSASSANQLAVPKPLVLDSQTEVLHSVLKQLDLSQWWSTAQMAQGQLQQLQRLLLHARAHSRFYQARLTNLDLQTLSAATFADIPILTRGQLQSANTTIDASVLPPDHGAVKETMTSGSTASPVRVRTTGVTALLWNAINLREHMWQQRDTSKVSCSIRWRGDAIGKTSAGVSLPDWGAPINQFYRTAPSYYLNSAVDIALQAKWLSKLQPAYLMSHPSNVAALAQYCRREGLALAGLQAIRTVGETVSDDLRELTRRVFNVPITDFYSSQELGYIALQCPQQEHYHVQAESVLLEVLRDDGSACDPFETGKLVITSLRNYATPLIRYEIGDYGALGEACPCGRGLPVLHSVSGRVRNMLTLPDGSKCWPNFGFAKMMEVVDIRQFQIVQTTIDTIELKLVLDATPLEAGQEARLKQILSDSLGYPFQITITCHGVLPRRSGGKFEDFVSQVSAEQR